MGNALRPHLMGARVRGMGPPSSEGDGEDDGAGAGAGAGLGAGAGAGSDAGAGEGAGSGATAGDAEISPLCMEAQLNERLQSGSDVLGAARRTARRGSSRGVKALLLAGSIFLLRLLSSGAQPGSGLTTARPPMPDHQKESSSICNGCAHQQRAERRDKGDLQRPRYGVTVSLSASYSANR